MGNRYALEDWLTEQDVPFAGGQPDPLGGGPPMDAAGMDAMPPDPNIANMSQDMGGTPEPEEDVSQDPQMPDMPEERDKGEHDFEIWKNNFFKESIKGDPNKLLDMLGPMRGRENLQPYAEKFVSDNWNIQLLRQQSNVLEASKQIRKLVRDQLDQNNPATSVATHMAGVLETEPLLKNKFIQILGYGSLKGELHRKFIAALTGSVQVSSSHDQENIVFNENDYSIMMATRFNARWGDVPLGNWTPREDDPERYLSEPELTRLQEGSPEEKEVLRKRVVIESITKHFETRAFIIHVVQDDGTIHSLGWDLSNSVRGAYLEGKLVVKLKESDNSEAMIDDNGSIIPLVDISIYFRKETGEQNEEGNLAHEDLEFIERRDGLLFLTAGMNTLRDAAAAMQGTEFKEMPWMGNPSDLKVLKRCAYTAHDMIMKTCG
jgi:hypothetical protein